MDGNDRPRFDVIVTNCGEIGGSQLKGSSSSSNGVEAGSVDHLLDDDGGGGARAGRGPEEDAEEAAQEEEEEEVDEAALGHMSDAQRRLFKLRMKINKGRKANKAAAGDEKKRLDDPYFGACLLLGSGIEFGVCALDAHSSPTLPHSPNPTAQPTLPTPHQHTAQPITHSTTPTLHLSTTTTTTNNNQRRNSARPFARRRKKRGRRRWRAEG